MKILILQDLPASGKSTFAKELMAKEPNKWKRINKDLLREMLDDSVWSKKNEETVLQIRDTLIVNFISVGFNVIIDDTNFSERHINKIKDIGIHLDINVEVKFFDTPLYECIERDANREKSVGKKVILKMYKQYLRCKNEVEFDKPNKELPNCIICDIDGTLAYSPNRSVYDYTKVGEDIPNSKLIKILELLDSQVVVFSGREDNCKELTAGWLVGKGIMFSKLEMRKTGDMREDSIIKEELYNEHVKGKYNVLAVIDDRPRVIRMWKKLGLFVLDANRQDPRIDF